MLRKSWKVLSGGAALVFAVACGREEFPEMETMSSAEGSDASSNGSEEGIPSLEDEGISGTDSFGSEGGNSSNVTAEGGTGCAEVNVDVQRTTPTLILLVDQSSSMTEDFQGQNRWDAVYETLMAPGTGVVAQLESSVRFGLTLYSSENGLEGGECPMLTNVAPAFGNLAAMDQTFTSADPIDETPTGESLAATAQMLAAFDAEGPKGIVLATDGEPDTCAEPNPQNGQDESLAAAEEAFEMGIRTFVISVGNEVGDAHLQDLANVGMGRPRTSSDPAPFYKALNSEELIRAFDEIVGGFLLCEFSIDGQVDASRACEGSVSIDGQSLDCGADWEVNGSSLRLMGEACELLGDGLAHAVEAKWPCGVVVPIP